MRERGKKMRISITGKNIEISDYLYKRNVEGAKELINTLENKYNRIIEELYSTNEFKLVALNEIRDCFNYIRSFSNDIFTLFEEREILSRGEIMSVALMYNYLREQRVNVVLLPALEFMKTDKNDEPDTPFIKSKLETLLERNVDAALYITHGYICRNAYGEIDNLKRGGSDLTASVIGAALGVDEIEIWTDIDGMHNNDPRYVAGTKPVDELHFEEAAELAYFGAKILHPTCVLPAKLNNIPVRLLNTMAPEAKGTVIYNTQPSHCIKAVAAKDNITAIKIKSSRMLLAYGFLRKVFEIFETHKVSIDMITTSEVGVSLTIDNEKGLDDIVNDLKKFGTVTIDHDMVIICVVGDLEWHNCGFETKAMEALKDIPVRMVSYGGSNYNISFLVSKDDKIKALNSLSDKLFK